MFLFINLQSFPLQPYIGPVSELRNIYVRSITFAYVAKANRWHIFIDHATKSSHSLDIA